MRTIQNLDAFPYTELSNQGHHGGSVKLIFTMLKNLVSLEQSHHKPIVIYYDYLLRCH